MLKNKFNLIIVFAAVCCIILSVSACEKSGGADAENTSKPVRTDENAPDVKNYADKEGYFFKTGDLTVYLGDDASETVSSLGEALNVFEAPSCAFEGTDRIYYYSDFKLYTFPEKDVDRILSIVFSNDLISTPEGISVGAAKDDVINAYGDGFTELNGSLIYEKSKTKLTFIITDGAVSSIQYYFNI